MTASTLNTQARRDGTAWCPDCRLVAEPKARFCGECGQPVRLASQTTYYQNAPVQSQDHSYTVSDSSNIVVVPPDSFRQGYASHEANKVKEIAWQTQQSLPDFVEVRDRRAKVDPELARELGQLVVALIREHVLLVVHWLVFLATNGFGFMLAAKCYYEYNGDELTRFIMALTPLMFVNSIGLVCLSPIKGGKQEIARLKERIAVTKVKIRHQDLVY